MSIMEEDESWLELMRYVQDDGRKMKRVSARKPKIARVTRDLDDTQGIR